jgi:hypothetical protein
VHPNGVVLTFTMDKGKIVKHEAKDQGNSLKTFTYKCIQSHHKTKGKFAMFVTNIMTDSTLL